MKSILYSYLKLCNLAMAHAASRHDTRRYWIWHLRRARVERELWHLENPHA